MMTITYSFTPNNTIRIHCGGDTLEVPLPPRAPDNIAPSSNIESDPRHFTADMPRPPIGRPRVPPTPAVVGIFTTRNLNIEQFTDILNYESNDTSGAIISFSDIETSPPELIDEHINNARDTMLYGKDNCFILDVGIHQNTFPSETQLSALENILRNSEHNLQGIRLLVIPDA